MEAVVGAAIALLCGYGGWLAVRMLTRRGTEEYRLEAARLGRIAGLSIEEAAGRATPLLDDERVFRCDEASGDEAALLMLPGGLQQLFRRCGAIVPVNDPDMSISRESLGPSELRPGYVRIGWVAGGDSEGELAVRPPEETIYVVHANEPIDVTFGTYRSVYHWMLAVSGEVTG